MVDNTPIAKGDGIMIRFGTPDWPYGFALCTYTGKRKGKHTFLSETYGWKYIVDLQANTVICTQNPDKVYEIDNSTGWADRLPR